MSNAQTDLERAESLVVFWQAKYAALTSRNAELVKAIQYLQGCLGCGCGQSGLCKNCRSSEQIANIALANNNKPEEL